MAVKMTIPDYHNQRKVADELDNLPVGGQGDSLQ